MPTLTTTTLGRFCRELAGGLDSIPVLLAEWSVTPQDFADIQASPAFIAEMRLVEQEMRDLGNDAGYIYRMKSLSESMLPEVITLLQDKNTSPMLKFDVIKWVAEMARLKEKPAPKGEFQGPRGPQVIFNFGAGLPVQSMRVIAAVPEAVENNVDSSGWPQ